MHMAGRTGRWRVVHAAKLAAASGLLGVPGEALALGGLARGGELMGAVLVEGGHAIGRGHQDGKESGDALHASWQFLSAL